MKLLRKEALFKGHLFKRGALQIFMERLFLMFIIQKIWNTVNYIEYPEHSHYRVLHFQCTSRFCVPWFSCLLKGVVLFASFYKVTWDCCEHTKHTKALMLMKLQIHNLNSLNEIFKTVYKDLVKSKDFRKWLVSIFWGTLWEIFSLTAALGWRNFQYVCLTRAGREDGDLSFTNGSLKGDRWSIEGQIR